MQHYDIIIVGAGINGCSLAYSLHQRGLKVLVLEQNGIATGGSGAAGAFINPKISKSGPLKELIEEAYLYSLDFYQKNFPESTTIAPLLHIAKYEDDNEKVDYFKEHTALATDKIPDELEKLVMPYAKGFSSVYLRDNAVLEAKDVCMSMLEGIPHQKMKVQEPVYADGRWKINDISADRVVLCTGAFDEIFPQPYIKLRRIFGQRCEIHSSTQMQASVHHEVSVSVTKKNGKIAIGASHYLNEEEMPSQEQGAKELIALAKKSVRLEDIEVVDVFSGMRSGSNDYLPVLGSLIDSGKSLMNEENGSSCVHFPRLYMINGVGGYGFVLAPYLAEFMCAHIIDGNEIPEYLDLKRFYKRWRKKESQR